MNHIESYLANLVVNVIMNTKISLYYFMIEKKDLGFIVYIIYERFNLLAIIQKYL